MTAEGPDFEAFLAALWRDFEAGRLRPLEDYLTQFPGLDADVRREFASVAALGDATTPLPRAGAGAESARDETLRAVPAAGASAGLPTSDPAPKGGARFGPYLLGPEIGRGGFGEVYVAEDTRFGRRVAIKVLTGRHAFDDDALARFRREARILSKLDHPGICTVFEAGQERGTPYLAMKLIPGETLARRLSAVRDRLGPASTGALHLEFLSDAEGPAAGGSAPAEDETRDESAPETAVDVHRVVRLIEDAARALHAAHEAGVIHRDVKPGNIMVTPEGKPVVLDFGLAYDAESDAPSLSRTGDLMGTPAYMSPEQIAARRIRLDRRTDVFSLGVVLFECLTLRRPFESPTKEGLLQAILTQTHPDPRTLNRSIPRDLRVVVATALDKDRDRRYATALALADDLRRVRRREPILARPPGPLTKLVRWAQRNPSLAAAVFALGLSLAAGLGISLALLGQKNAALEDYDRLGDISRLRAFAEASAALWPAEPPAIPDLRRLDEEGGRLAPRLAEHEARLRAWRKEAEGLDPGAESRAVARRTAEEAALAELKRESRKAAAAAAAAGLVGGDPDPFVERAAALDAESARLARRLAEPPRPRFHDESMQFRYDSTADLCTALRQFLDPDPFRGEWASVRARLQYAESVAANTLEKHAARWAEAVRAIGDGAGRYGGLEITPQLGLIPLGPDPESGLWEFVDFATTAAGSDPIPPRGANGRLLTRAEDGLVFVLLPGGEFTMGARKPTNEERAAIARGDAPPPNVDPGAAADEGPPHRVKLAPFFLSKYEMTQAQWARVTGARPSHFAPGSPWGGKSIDLRHPVESVTWTECDLWLTRIGCRLPTEAQWEYGCRGGTTTAFWSGPLKISIATGANLADQFGKQNGGGDSYVVEDWSDGRAVHAPVGSYLPNPFGLHDVAGNVYEWCADGMHSYGAVGARAGDGFRGPTSSPARATRGGSFYFIATSARSSDRADDAADTRNDDLGVRPARELRSR